MEIGKEMKIEMDREEKSEGKIKILTVLIADIANYSRISSGLGREALNNLHDVFDSICIPTIKKYRGKIVKKMGDSYIAIFESATESLFCGMELQNEFVRYNGIYKPKNPLMIKVAVNSGEAIVRKEDIYGDVINLVSRIEKIVKPGEVYFTQPVFLAMNKNEIPFQYLGQKVFKGFKYPVKIFRVRGVYNDILRARIMRKRKLWRIFWKLVILGAAIYVIYKLFSSGLLRF